MFGHAPDLGVQLPVLEVTVLLGLAVFVVEQLLLAAEAVLVLDLVAVPPLLQVAVAFLSLFLQQLLLLQALLLDAGLGLLTLMRLRFAFFLSLNL